MMTDRSASVPGLADDEDDAMAELDASPLGTGTTRTTRTTETTNVVSMGLGDGESWAIMSDGLVKGWGKRYCSQAECFVPADNEPLALDDAALEIHSNGSQGVVRLANGDVFVWDEEIGAPTQFHLASFDGEPVQVALGLDFVCARLDRGQVDCQPLPGQSVSPPEWLDQFDSPAGIVELSAGAHHACALKKWGTVICWGDNDTGQLGPPSNKNSTPIELDGPARSIAAGGAHTCALLEDGTVQCWGANGEGQLGHTNPGVGRVPIESAIAIAAGAEHSCAIDEDHDLYCWGSNSLGQLGADGSDDDGIRRVDLGGHKAAKVFAGANEWTTFAVLEHGGLRGWGHDDRGQTGYGWTHDGPGGHETLGVGDLDDIPIIGKDHGDKSQG